MPAAPPSTGTWMPRTSIFKAFTEDFYHRTCAARLADVLDTLRYLRHETDAWFEITTLLISGHNDSDDELDAETAWIASELGTDVPLHFSAFHPDYKMVDVPRTPPATLTRARRIALGNGLRYVYTGRPRHRGRHHDLSGLRRRGRGPRLVRDAPLPAGRRWGVSRMRRPAPRCV
jgi:AmmeMemoRadiSam system radical SAM enzyme